jgi:hypothetical protein
MEPHAVPLNGIFSGKFLLKVLAKVRAFPLKDS